MIKILFSISIDSGIYYLEEPMPEEVIHNEWAVRNYFSLV